MNRRTEEKIAFLILRVASIVVLIPTAFIIYFLVVRGARGLSLEFLFSYPRENMTAGGILPAIIGTLYLVAGTIVFSVPLGVLSAIYLSEYAKPGPITRLIRLSIVNLAGVPSIVYGLFGFGIFVLLLRLGASILSGSLTLAILVLPLVIVASEEALRSVPQSFRDASLALGGSKWQTVRRIVLPNALPGILTGVILAIGRAAGETAPVLFTVAAFYLPRLPQTIYDQAMVLPYHLYIISTQVPNSPPHIQWGTALTLLIIVLGMNIIAMLIRAMYRRRIPW